jgi:hypothetical protein
VVLRVAQRAFASIYVGRVAEAHGAGCWTWLPHASKDEFDAGTRCADDAVDEALCPSASDALDTETCELCRELLPDPEPELVFHERERKAR